MTPTPEERDRDCGFDVREDFERFRQRNDIFCRSFWDDTVRTGKTEAFYDTYRKPLRHYRDVDGFGHRDYALRNASWHLPDVFAELREGEDRREGFLDPYTALREGSDARRPFPSTREATLEIKRVARAAGADLVGVTEWDERWVYADAYSAVNAAAKPIDLPAQLSHVIVVATGMDHELVETVPSALSGAATGFGYSRDVLTVLALAQYVENLGYRAVPSLNDTALAIPLAIRAGLGEYGRNGLLITPEFGPRVRLGKVFTDLPLEPDRPIRFGVREFCDVCRRCADACPVKAIPQHEPEARPHNVSNVVGVRKWSVDAERCFSFWAGQNSDCSICIRVCPYNKDYRRWVFRFGRRLAGTFLRRWLPALDAWLGFGARRSATRWWGRPDASRLR